MTDIKRLGLGCMSMRRQNEEKSIRTIHAALDAGITLFNTGDFYGSGESELVVGKALKNVPRDKYFLSVKFGVLNKPNGQIYGLDVNPFNIKSHLAYSLHRLGLDYIDLYQPARMDLAYPVEEIIGAMADLVKEGYIRHIGLTQLDEENLRRARAVHPIHTVELRYSLAERGYETGMFPAARDIGANLLAFGVLAHGLLNDGILDGKANTSLPIGFFSAENLPKNLELVRALQEFAKEKGTTVSRIALAWALAKNPDMAALVGTTSEAHLMDSVEALRLDLSTEDIAEIEKAFPAEKVMGKGMLDFVCKNGRPVLP